MVDTPGNGAQPLDDASLRTAVAAMPALPPLDGLRTAEDFRAAPSVPFVYGLVDPLDTRHVRYVGLAMRRERPFIHARDARRSGTFATNKINWIRKIQAEGREPVALILEELPKDSSLTFVGFVESCYIKSLKEIGHRLTNLTDGGDGVVNPSPEVREQMSRSAKARPAFSLETRAKMSASKMGHVVTQAHREKLRKTLTGQKHPAERVEKNRVSHLGQTQTAEHRAKNSAANRGRILTPETRAKMSAAWAYRAPITDETRAKQRVANLAWRARKKEANNG